MEITHNKIIMKTSFAKLITALLLFNCLIGVSVLAETKTDSEGQLIQNYIQTKGDKIIVFDASNAKQFWIDNSVACIDNSISVRLKTDLRNQYASVPLKIQLANVCEADDCIVEILTESKGASFNISNQKKIILAKSVQKDDFIRYHIHTAVVHLEETDTFSFNLNLFSNDTDSLSIKKIILSFSANKESGYLGSPGFDNLVKIINGKGTKLPDNDIRYFIDNDYNKIYIMIPDDLVGAYRYFYQVWPVDEANLAPGRKEHQFNNMLFSTKEKNIVIPKPYLSNSKYSIIQQPLPPFEYSIFQIGQYTTGKKIWLIKLTNDVAQQ